MKVQQLFLMECAEPMDLLGYSDQSGHPVSEFRCNCYSHYPLPFFTVPQIAFRLLEMRDRSGLDFLRYASVIPMSV